MIRYPIAEKFKSVQGEGVHTGVPMAFIRLVGCSVGKHICHACDTDFEAVHEKLGGGLFTAGELNSWVDDYLHVCITGGEPMMRDIYGLIHTLSVGFDDGVRFERKVHVETSGTRIPEWLFELKKAMGKQLWITVSPKPGYLEEMIGIYADELKVVYKGLGDGPGWMTLDEILKWSEEEDFPVYLQPRNDKHTVIQSNLREVIDIVERNPTLRLSVQLHKFLEVR
jgi:7-carboxy-7-deazaguanine synthase